MHVYFPCHFTSAMSYKYWGIILQKKDINNRADNIILTVPASLSQLESAAKQGTQI